jgi:hypothetical protein
MVSVSVDRRVREAFKVLARQYKKQSDKKGQMSLSDAAWQFLKEHAPEVTAVIDDAERRKSELVGDDD